MSRKERSPATVDINVSTRCRGTAEWRARESPNGTAAARPAGPLRTGTPCAAAARSDRRPPATPAPAAAQRCPAARRGCAAPDRRRGERTWAAAVRRPPR